MAFQFSCLKAYPQDSEMQLFEHKFATMGIEAKIIAYANDRKRFESAKNVAVDLTRKIERSLSNYDKNSECEMLVRLSANDGPVRVSDELFEILKLSQRINQLTDGAFDPTIGAATSVWRMARKRNRLPTTQKLANAMQSAGMTKIIVNDENQSVDVESEELRFDFGGIAKGFAADQVLKVFQSRQIHSVLVDFSGDVAVGQKPPNKDSWRIKIDTSSIDKKLVLRVNDCAVATSGDSKQRLVKNQKRYSHIIDPRTGLAIENSCAVTVITKPRNTALADALASAISVLGPVEGIQILDKFPGTEVRTVAADGTQVSSESFAKFIESKLLTDPATSLGN